MRFAPQRCAMLWHAKFKKWSGAEVSCTSWLENVLHGVPFLRFGPQRRAIFHFSSGAPAALASLLFDPPEPQIGKTQRFATFLTCRGTVSSFYSLSRRCIFFLLTLLICSAFHLSTVGSLTSKLPLITWTSSPDWSVGEEECWRSLNLLTWGLLRNQCWGMLGFLEIACMVGGGWEPGGRGILTRLEFAHAAQVKLLHIGLVTPSQPMQMFVFFRKTKRVY